MNNGWVKLYRQIQYNGFYKKSIYVHLWVHLLINANHKPEKFMWNNNIMVVKSGQLITGRKALSDKTGISETSIERILNHLEKEHQIEQQKTNKYRLITIVNWKTYQNEDNKRTTNGQQTDTNKNDKKEKNDKNNNAVPSNDGSIEDLLNEDSPIKYDYQFQGLELYEKINAPKDKKSECIRLAKKYPKYINPALSFSLDYPNPALKWKMFLWKLNQLIKNANNKTSFTK